MDQQQGEEINQRNRPKLQFHQILVLDMQMPLSSDSSLQHQRYRDDDYLQAKQTLHSFIKHKQQTIEQIGTMLTPHFN